MMTEFKLLTRPDAMQALFQDRLPAFAHGEHQITACRVLRTRFKPSDDKAKPHNAYLCVQYELDIAGADGASAGVQQLFAHAYLDGRSQRKFRRVDTANLATPQFGEALVHLPDLGLIVWAFPNDPDLPHLPLAVDGEQVKPYLPYSRLPAGFGRPEAVAKVGVEVVRYKPEVRCTLRYDLTADGPQGPETLALYGKTYASGKGQELYGHIERLWQQSQADAQAFRVAQPLGYDNALHMVWQAGLAGIPLSRALDGATYLDYLPLAARGLARLHQSRLALTRHVTTTMLLAEVGAGVAELFAALPEHEEKLQHFLAQLADDETRLAPAPAGVIHGDFHAKQLLINPDDSDPSPALALFDFDDLALGDPEQDLAFFLVDLHFRELAPHLVRQMAAHFLQAYQFHAGAERPPDRLGWHLRLQYLTKAHWYFKKKQHSPRLTAYIQRVLSLAEQEALLSLERV